MASTIKADIIANAASATDNLTLGATGGVTVGGDLSVGGNYNISGTLTLGTPLTVGNGGTGLTSLATSRIPYGNGTSAFSSSASLTYNGTTVSCLLNSSSTNTAFYGNQNLALQLGNTSNTAGNGAYIANSFYNGGINAYIGFLNVDQNYASAITFGTSVSGASNYGERMRIDSAGNLGLGVTPSAWTAGKALEVGALGNALWGVGASNCVLTSNAYYNTSSYYYASTQAASNYQQYQGAHRWYTAPSGTVGGAISFTQAMTLDASGRLGVGETSPNAPLCVSLATNPATDNGAGSNTLRVYTTQTQAADVGGAISLGGQGVGAVVGFGQIAGRKENSTSSDNSGYLQFATLNSGGTMAERARIDSSGNLLVGLTSTSGGAGLGRLTIKSNSNTAATNFVIEAVSTTDKWGHIIASNLDYYFNLNGNGKGYINNSTGAYTAVSDARLKKNIADCDYGLAQISQLRPVTFNMLNESDSDKKHIGFIAQEVKAVIDEAVDDLPSEDRYYGLDKSGLVPVLVKAIQELAAKVSALEAKI